MTITIRGVDYASGAAAGRALGVRRSTVNNAIERGTLQYVGLGRNYLTKTPVIVDGVKYETITAAVEAVSYTHLRAHET